MIKRILNTEDYKVGDKVWVCNILFSTSGRIKFNLPPSLREIKDVKPDRIKLKMSSSTSYYEPSEYYIFPDIENLIESNPYYSDKCIDYHVSKTKEEAEEKYNYLI